MRTRACCCSKPAAGTAIRWIRIPLAWGRNLLSSAARLDVFHRARGDARTGARIECARGKVIGGSSSINAMAYVRGHRGDYERWAATGLAGWSYAHVLPYFRRQESWEGGASAYRGGDGPLSTRSARYPRSAGRGLRRRGRAAGHPGNRRITTARSRRASRAGR